MRVDQYSFTNSFSATTTITLNVNLPSQTAFTDKAETISLTVVDSNGKTRAVTATFVKTPAVNQWQMLFSADNLTSVTQAPGAAFTVTTGCLTSAPLGHIEGFS
jgi:hypothetical protein